MLTENHIFREELRVQKVRYILSGKGEEHYIPHFSYFGYRYIRVVGITAGQAKPSLLTMLPAHSDIGSRGAFACSDERLNQLQEYARRSTLSNLLFSDGLSAPRKKRLDRRRFALGGTDAVKF